MGHDRHDVPLIPVQGQSPTELAFFIVFSHSKRSIFLARLNRQANENPCLIYVAGGFETTSWPERASAAVAVLLRILALGIPA